MPSRNLLQYLIISAKGIAMGAADVVPGVSGGTIAFISGIYEELIETIHKLDLNFFKVWKSDGIIKAFKHYNLGFLFFLFSGVLVSILSLAKLLTWLLETHPIYLWSFFFGLILASIIYVGKQISDWKLAVILALILAIIPSYLITIAEPIGSPESTWFLFFAGFIAIIAMILPGISGAFILLLLGAYTAVLSTITQFTESAFAGNWSSFWAAGLKLLVFALGAITGLKVFSKALNWMFAHHKDLILAILTGFMIGALNKIWPWKKILSFRTNSHGEQVPFLDQSILPSAYDGDPKILIAILFMLLGFVIIFVFERLAKVKETT